MHSRKLFLTFLRIGLFTIGGGYAMLPLMRREIVERQQWLSADEFADGLTAAQSAPGPLAVNIGVFVGYHLNGMRGALAATAGVVAPAFFVLIMIASALASVGDNIWLNGAFRALKPTVTVLIGYSVFRAYGGGRLKPAGIVAAGLATLLLAWGGVHPVWLICIALLTAFWHSLWQQRRKR